MEGKRLGRYELGRRLAAGGMAEVFAAKVAGAAGFEKSVAVKRVLPHLCEDPEFLEMFREEARLASLLSHANIAQVFDFDEIDGQYLLAMEWVHGKDLRRALRAGADRGLPPTPARAAHIAREVARALHYAHTVPGPDGRPLCLVHRDVSPQNILLSFAGEVKLTDFGIAKAAISALSTCAGVIKGKSPYMSPEQARGEPLDARSDVFAVGIVLWECLTGRRLFTGDSDTEILRAVQTREPPRPSTIAGEVPRDLDEVVLTALSKDKHYRHESAARLEVALTEVILDHAGGAADLDIAEWLSGLFPEQRPSEEAGSPDAPVGGHETRPRRTAKAAPTPPRPGDFGSGASAGTSLAPEESTADVEVPAPPRARKAAQASLITFGAALIMAAAVAFALHLPGAHDSSTSRETRGASQAPGTDDPRKESGAEPAPPGKAPTSTVPARRDDPGDAALEARPERLEPSSPETADEAAPPPSRGASSFDSGLQRSQAGPPMEEEGDALDPKGPARAGPRDGGKKMAGHERKDVEEDASKMEHQEEEPSAPSSSHGSATMLTPVETSFSSAPPREKNAPVVVPAGTRLQARLTLGVECERGGEGAPAEARLVRSHVSGERLLLSRGALLRGRATLRNERVAISFDRMTEQSGRSHPVGAEAYGPDGRPGVPALDSLTTADEDSEGDSITLSPRTDLTVVLTEDLHLDQISSNGPN